MERSGDIPPGNRHCSNGPVAEVDGSRAPGRRHWLELSRFTDHAAIRRSLQTREHGPAGYAAGRSKREHQTIGRRKPLLQVNREAVRGDDVKTDAGQQDHAGRPGVGVSGRQVLEHGDFARDVEIIDFRSETGIRHRPGRSTEWTGGN